MNIRYFIFPLYIFQRNLRWAWLKWRYLHKPMIINLFGQKMFLDIQSVGWDWREKNIFKQLALDGIREQSSTRIMSDMVAPDDHILEAGANVGYYVLLEASRLGPTGRVLALEPDFANFQLLQKNIAINQLSNKVTLCQEAVSDKLGQASFYVSQDSNLHSLLQKDPKTIREKIIVQTTTIDALLQKYPQINFVRMDIEGLEPRVIQGMKKFLKKRGPLKLFIELHPHLVSLSEMAALLEELKANHFQLHKLVFRDKNLRHYLGQVKVEQPTLDQLKNDPRLLERKIGCEAFFIKPE